MSCRSTILAIGLLILAAALPKAALGAAATTPATQPYDWRAIDKEILAAEQRTRAKLSLRAVFDKKASESERRLKLADRIHAEFVQACEAGRFDDALGKRAEPVANPVFAFDGMAVARQSLLAIVGAAYAEVFGQDSVQLAIWFRIYGEAFRGRGLIGDEEQAERVLEQARAASEAFFKGRPHPLRAEILRDLATTKVELSRFREAGPLLAAALAIRKQTGTQTFGVTLDLAEYHRHVGAFSAAEHFLAKAGEAMVREKVGGPAGLLLKQRRARLLRDTGAFDESRALLTEVIAAVEQPGAPSGAPTMARAVLRMERGVLALYQLSQDRPTLDQAIDDLAVAAELAKREGGALNPFYLITLPNLVLLRGMRDTPADVQHITAELREIDRLRQVLPNQPPQQTAQLYSLQCLIQIAIGQPAAAEASAAAAARIMGESLGAEHPLGAFSVIGHAWTLSLLGRHDEADQRFTTAMNTFRGHLDLTLAGQAERQQFQLLAYYRRALDMYVANHRAAGRLGPQTYAHVLAWKGIAFSAQRAAVAAADTDSAARAASAAYARELSQLQAAEYQRASTAGPQPELDKQIEQARARVAELRRALVERLQASRRTISPVSPAAVQASLPAGAVLVDFLRYSEQTPPTAEGSLWSMLERYVAFVVRPDRIDAVDLGPAARIDDALARFRADQTFGRDDGLALRRLTWSKIEPHLGEARLVLIAPDGPLAAMPFAALPASDDANDDAYLIERIALATVAVPQLLAESHRQQTTQPATRPAGGAVVLVGGVEYDADPGARPAGTAELAMAPAMRSGHGGWAFLPGTAREMDRIGPLFRAADPAAQPRALRGRDATEARFIEAVRDARYVHVGTHGFFAEAGIRSMFEPAHAPALSGGGKASGALEMVDPGLLSGICLAGANRGRGMYATIEASPIESMAPPPSPAAPLTLHDDGILTAAEVATLDLRRTQLLVLSGCETGLGRAAGGEGLLGLQRAFQIAGVRSVVASLWRVDDERSADLMETFYRELLVRGYEPAVALRRAQFAMLSAQSRSAGPARGTTSDPTATTAPKISARTHPSLWAAWVISGDPGELHTVLHQLNDPLDPPPVASASPPAVAVSSTAWWRWPAAGTAAVIALACAFAAIRRHRRA